MQKILLEADGFILATPVNWMNVSTLMKNFIDKLTVLVANNYRLEGKAAGFIATEEQCGSVEALNAMAFLQFLIKKEF